MKILNWIGLSINMILAFWWANKLHAYFFDYATADAISMLFALGLGFVLSLFLTKYTPNRWILFCFLFITPLLLYYLILSTISFTDNSWLFIYGFLFVQAALFYFKKKWRLQFSLTIPYVLIIFLPINFSKEQSKFFDQVVASVETRKGSGHLVKWKKDYWVYYNDRLQYATLDRHILQEAYVRPASFLTDSSASVLLIGGDNGIVEDELSKIKSMSGLMVIPFDREFYDFIRSKDLGLSIFPNKTIHTSQDIFQSVAELKKEFDLIIIDVPDPINIEYGQFYSSEFYQLCLSKLDEKGLLVTQTGDAIRNLELVHSIANTFNQLGFDGLTYQTQIPTIGQWSWILISNNSKSSEIETMLRNIPKLETVWWNQEAMDLMISSGKSTIKEVTHETISLQSE